MGLVVDTSVFTTSERRRKNADLSAWRHYGTPCISVVTLAELLHGVHRADTQERRSRRERFVSAIENEMAVVAFDEAVSRTYAQVWAELKAGGKALGAHDMMIAATAKHYGHALLTADGDFERVAGVDVQWFPVDRSPAT